MCVQSLLALSRTCVSVCANSHLLGGDRRASPEEKAMCVSRCVCVCVVCVYLGVGENVCCQSL